MSKKNETLEFDPNVMFNCLDEANAMYKGHVMILEAVASAIKKAKKMGCDDEVAAGIALTLHKRAAEKASKMAHVNDEDMVVKEEKEDDHTKSDG